MADTRDTSTLMGLRDRALLLVGVDTGLRRPELVGIDVEHIDREPAGIVIGFPTSKGLSDEEGAHVVLLPDPARRGVRSRRSSGG